MTLRDYSILINKKKNVRKIYNMVFFLFVCFCNSNYLFFCLVCLSCLIFFSLSLFIFWRKEQERLMTYGCPKIRWYSIKVWFLIMLIFLLGTHTSSFKLIKMHNSNTIVLYKLQCVSYSSTSNRSPPSKPIICRRFDENVVHTLWLKFQTLISLRWSHWGLGPLLLTWINVNPSMDK